MNADTGAAWRTGSGDAPIWDISTFGWLGMGETDFPGLRDMEEVVLFAWLPDPPVARRLGAGGELKSISSRGPKEADPGGLLAEGWLAGLYGKKKR